jgi:hypothetical protein
MQWCKITLDDFHICQNVKNLFNIFDENIWIYICKMSSWIFKNKLNIQHVIVELAKVLLYTIYYFESHLYCIMNWWHCSLYLSPILFVTPLLAPHDHTFRFMITFTSCFTMFLGHGQWTFPKCRGQTLLLPLHRPLILRMPPTLGLCPTYNELPRKLVRVLVPFVIA